MRRRVFQIILPAVAATFFASCSSTPNSPGVEYMPDMYRSPSIEAYVDYAHPTTLSARKPAPGTIPFTADSLERMNNIPYTYPNTAEGYEAAGAALTNPLPLSQPLMVEGKSLYSKFCVHCHGAAGNGDGSMVQNDKFPPPPAYSAIPGLTTGKIFHTITYGKGLMGPHASLLNKTERWILTHYVEQLRDGNTSGKLAADSATANTVAPADTAGQVQ